MPSVYKVKMESNSPVSSSSGCFVVDIRVAQEGSFIDRGCEVVTLSSHTNCNPSQVHHEWSDRSGLLSCGHVAPPLRVLQATAMPRRLSAAFEWVTGSGIAPKDIDDDAAKRPKPEPKTQPDGTNTTSVRNVSSNANQ